MSFDSDLLRDHLLRRIGADPDYARRVSIYDYGCFGRCGEGPNLFVRELADGEDPNGEPEVRQLLNQRGFYPGVDERVCDRVLDEHCGQGRPLDGLVDEY